MSNKCDLPTLPAPQLQSRLRVLESSLRDRLDLRNGGGQKGDKHENRAWSRYARWEVNQIEAVGRGEEEKGRRWARSREKLLSTRGSVIAGSLKSRASDDQASERGDAERGCKNARCTCLYLFCIISAALPRVPPAGFAAGLISFPFFAGPAAASIPYYFTKSLAALRELIKPRC